jgi:hypothetical protein
MAKYNKKIKSLFKEKSFEKYIQEINKISNENKENIIIIKYLLNVINEQNKKMIRLNKLE